LIYHFHLIKDYSLKAKPFMDDKEHGIFAIRGPARPNPIGLSVVRLIQVEDNFLHIQDLDIIDGTPLLGIKPYVPRFDGRTKVHTGWLEDNVDKVEKQGMTVGSYLNLVSDGASRVVLSPRMIAYYH
jgi:tRNA (Thr-GGU) A37 N-methylase